MGGEKFSGTVRNCDQNWGGGKRSCRGEKMIQFSM